MARYIIIFLFTFHFASLFSNELTIKDIVDGKYAYNSFDKFDKLYWRGSSNLFLYTDDSVLIEVSADNLYSKVILTIKEINIVLNDHKITEIITFPEIEVYDFNNIGFIHENKFILFNITNKILRYYIEFPDNTANINYNFLCHKATFNVANNLFIADSNSSIDTITNESINSEIFSGFIANREEFSTEQGTFWSPNGNYIAYYKTDVSKVKNYPLEYITDTNTIIKEIKYPMAGQPTEKVKLFIYSIDEKSNIAIDTKETDQYITNITWKPDESYIYTFIINREQNNSRLNKFDVATGKLIRTILEEKHKKYVEPLFPVSFLPDEQNKFIYLSRNKGYNHLYIFDEEKSESIQLTSGKWEVTDFLGFDKKGNNIFFLSTENSPLENNIYKLKIENKYRYQLNSCPGYHDAIINSDKSYIIDIFSNNFIPKKIDLINTANNAVINVFEKENPLKDYSLGEVVTSTIKSADRKTDLYYRLIKPVNFNDTVKYPVIVYVYGGPHVQLVRNRWFSRTELWQQYMAQKGFISFTLDTRGSNNRGLEFENVIYRGLGIPQAEDQLEGIKFLETLKYADTGQIGVYGWSFGGYMSTTLSIKYPDIFKVGVAGAPVTDWKYYEVMYTERYMDTPDENPDGYEKTNLLNYIDDLKSKLLIVHGTLDSTVVIQHSYKFIKECIRKGKLIELFIYPNHNHHISGDDRIHLYEMISEYFNEYLKDD